MPTFSYLSPSECGGVFDAMDNAGWYFWFDGSADCWGPFDSRTEADVYAARVTSGEFASA